MKFPLTVSLVFGSIVFSLHADTLTYPDLVDRLTSLQHLATPPAKGEEGALASSYDRHSQYDAAKDQYIAWDANGDGNFGGQVPMDGDEVVMADIKGPGCIWRTWAATPQAGHVKIYLDGSKTPAVDLPFTSYFDGKSEPFSRPNLVYRTAANGFDNFTPISFQKSCRILADKGWGNYFHFNYTTFPADTVVPTFALPLSATDTAALDKANAIFDKCGDDPAGARPSCTTEKVAVTIPAGAQGLVIDLKGPQAITGLRATFDPGQLPTDIEAQRTLLGQLTLRMNWDGQANPAVWTPIGDFFGNSAGAVPHRNLPSGLKDDGTSYAYWYMPFATEGKIAVDNDSDHPVSMHWEVVHEPLTQPADSLLRFHAKWHRDPVVPMRDDRKKDWPLVITQGKGRFVGTQLHVWNPRGGWWGEGDEKFFVDGEKFPSTFGTGSEDYFGYAWSSGKTFIQALHSQPVNENNQGHVSVNRWHIADNIPFQTGFEGIIEKYFTNDRPTLYAETSFWYLSADGKDDYAPLPVTDRVGWWVRPVQYNEPNAIEGESLRPTEQPEHHIHGRATWQITPNTWSGDQHLVWPPTAVGEKISFNLPPIDKEGDYQFIARFSKGHDYGTFQLSIDGKDIGSPYDLYTDSPNIIAAPPATVGTLHLTAGAHVFTITVTGKNAGSKADNASDSDYDMGLDYIKFVPVP